MTKAEYIAAIGAPLPRHHRRGYRERADSGIASRIEGKEAAKNNLKATFDGKTADQIIEEAQRAKAETDAEMKKLIEGKVTSKTDQTNSSAENSLPRNFFNFTFVPRS